MGFLDRDRLGIYKHASGKGPGPALMGSDTLIGESVINNEGLSLGDIKEIMLDMRTGQVAYAVLAFGGFFGLGEKLFAVPWQAMRLDTVQKCFVLDVDKDKLKSAPGFNSHSWPDMTDVEWMKQVHSFYGTDMAGTGVPVDGMVGGAVRGAGASSGPAIGETRSDH
jgi:sporulation protein YlmC with PRC-barrel domain